MKGQLVLQGGSPSTDYSNSYSSGYPEYNTATYSSYSGQKNPYGTNYQGGSDQNYGVASQHSYGTTDYSGYGTQGSNGYSSGNSQWPSTTYGQQQYGYGNSNDGWQPAQSQQSSWQQTGNSGNSAGYRNLQVEQMFPMEGTTDYSNQMRGGGYDNSGYGYGTNEGSDYQQSAGMSGYSNTGQNNYGTTDQSHYGSQPSYQSSNYGTPTYSTATVGTGGRQFGYGNNDYSNQYSGSNDGYSYSGTKYSSYGTSQDYDRFTPQPQYVTSYVPTQTTSYGNNNYGAGNYDQSGGYQSSNYNPYTSSDYSSYSGAQNTNNGYRSDNSYGIGYSAYSKPQVEFAMNFGYGSQKNGRNIDVTPKLTNNLSPMLATDDGYKAKNA
ncbi:hypothetical protein Y032_0017g3467 [Ancylostoma ceylanicum]|uniref:Uncharacterized protein n=1 Tax=Ancylostoma ceylanicum TaxID=53326 RepID=A0A016V4Q2_9BILA|nr:hypothetical protein Y032_0017g3467 [Ancylostoma ceylanicum]